MAPPAGVVLWQWGMGAGSTSEGQPGLAGEEAGDDQVHLSWILSVLVLWHLMGAQSVLLSRWMCVPVPFRVQLVGC